MRKGVRERKQRERERDRERQKERELERMRERGRERLKDNSNLLKKPYRHNQYALKNGWMHSILKALIKNDINSKWRERNSNEWRNTAKMHDRVR